MIPSKKQKVFDMSITITQKNIPTITNPRWYKQRRFSSAKIDMSSLMH
jgi:hypothetical protein